jgi:hypothetical protein
VLAYGHVMPVGTRPNPPADTVRVALSGTVWGHKWANVFWLRLTTSGAVTVTDLQTIANAVAAAYNTNILTFCGNQTVLSEVSLLYYDASGPALAYVAAPNDVGGQPSTFPDASGSYLVQWVISAAYRGGHPRSYFPGPNNGDIQTGGQLISSAHAALATHANDLHTAVNAITSTNVTTVEMGTVSFVRAAAWRTPPVFYPYTSAIANGSIGTIKRRIRS